MDKVHDIRHRFFGKREKISYIAKTPGLDWKIVGF
jgi:hypothetical protein